MPPLELRLHFTTGRQLSTSELQIFGTSWSLSGLARPCATDLQPRPVPQSYPAGAHIGFGGVRISKDYLVICGRDSARSMWRATHLGHPAMAAM
jgi:hypothetical protein